MTNAQARILSTVIDEVQIATRDLHPDDVILVLYAMLDLRGDITPERQETLANDLGLAAHMRARKALKPSLALVETGPRLLADMRSTGAM